MASTRSRTTAQLTPRLAASFALIPLSFGITLTWYVLAAFVGASIDWLIATGFFALPLITYYGGGLLIWRRTVTWTRGRVAGVTAISLALVGLLLVGLRLLETNGDASLAILCGTPTIGGGLALIAVNRICWTPPQRDTRSVPCPQCRHNLYGARACECPACGGRFTLAQLVDSTAVADALGITETPDDGHDAEGRSILA
jgi:hypothetical protein